MAVPFTTAAPNTRIKVTASASVEGARGGFNFILVAVDELANPLMWGSALAGTPGDSASVSFSFVQPFDAGLHSVTLWVGGNNPGAFVFIAPDPTNFLHSAVLLVEQEG
jgi:hypothetical protein